MTAMGKRGIGVTVWTAVTMMLKLHTPSTMVYINCRRWSVGGGERQRRRERECEGGERRGRVSDVSLGSHSIQLKPAGWGKKGQHDLINRWLLQE